jgi:hypothetical protein
MATVMPGRVCHAPTIPVTGKAWRIAPPFATIFVSRSSTRSNIMSERPTEKASYEFEVAKNTARNFNIANKHHELNMLCMAVGNMAEGLKHMNTGLRATYILLEEVKTLLTQKNTSRPGEHKA